jgi:integrase
LKLAEARRKAEEIRLVIGRGEDPSKERRASHDRHRAAASGVGTLGSVIAAYYEQGPGAALRSGVAARALVERIFVDHLQRASLDINTPELQLVIDRWRSKSSAWRVAACFRPLVRWAAKRGLMVKGDMLEAPTRQGAKQHVLTHDEAAQLLRVMGWHGYDAAARFMLLTAARREEVCGATWGEISPSTGSGQAVWTIPAARRKDTRPNSKGSKEDHVIPLSPQALALLEQQGQQPFDILHQAQDRAGSELVFAGSRGARLTNWSRWSAWVEKQLGFDVSPHTLRRTCATLAGDLGQPPHVVSALLGHRSIGGLLHAGYNQSRYRAEVGLALQKVADWLDMLEAGGSNVVPLPNMISLP